jgi:hypothetical protein
MPWDYLQNPVLQVRQRIAAHFLRDSESVLEIGAFKTPITGFLVHQPKDVTIIDPLAVPFTSDELNGRPCRVRHLAITLRELDLNEWRDKRFGLLFCGMDLNREQDEPANWLDTVCRFLFLISRAQAPVLEYPVNWQPSAKLFQLILSLLQPRIAADMGIDLTLFPAEGEVTDEVRSRFHRRMVLLTDMKRAEGPNEFRERAARILFGSEAAPFILGTSSNTFREVPGAIDLKRASQLQAKAYVHFRDAALEITTMPDAWSYAALAPITDAALSQLSRNLATPATVEIEVAVDQGEIGLGLLHKGTGQITGERLIRAADKPQKVNIFIPDLRDHEGLLCRNGQLAATVTKARILKAALALPA